MMQTSSIATTIKRSWTTIQIRGAQSWRNPKSKLPEWRRSSTNDFKNNNSNTRQNNKISIGGTHNEHDRNNKSSSSSSSSSSSNSNSRSSSDKGADIEDLKRAYFQNVGSYQKKNQQQFNKHNNHNKSSSSSDYRKTSSLKDRYTRHQTGNSTPTRRNTNILKKSGWRNGDSQQGQGQSQDFSNRFEQHRSDNNNNNNNISSKKRYNNKQQRKPKKKMVFKKQPKIVRLPTHLPSISAEKLASLLRVKRRTVNKLCKDLDISVGEQIEMDMATLVCEELGYEITSSDTEEETQELLVDLERPLVVSIMGHVDHGKTTLLDALRKRSNHPERPVAGSEAGGITQKITAFQIPLYQENNDSGNNTDEQELLTVLDTPGHAAFSEMRRICQSASDLVILCIDIRQGVADQTIEILSYLKESDCQFMVALTKCDLIEMASDREKLLMKVESQLAEHDITTESFGGEVQVVPVSSVTGEGLDILISSTNDFYEPQAKTTSATVLNSESGAGGKLLSVILHQPISSGEYFILESLQTNTKKYGKIRSIMPVSSNTKTAKSLGSAETSTPIMILSDVEGALAGDSIRFVENEDTARSIVEKAEELSIFENYTSTTSEDKNNKQVNDEIPTIPLLLKSPTSASLAALETSIQSMQASNSDKFKFNIINTEVGTSMTPKEQIMLKESNGLFLGFDIPNVPKKITKNYEKNQIMSNDIIYRLLDNTKEYIAKQFLPPIESHNVHGTAKVLQVFSVTSEKKVKVNIAGMEVTSGVLIKKSNFKVKKSDSDEIFELIQCDSLRRFKEEVIEVRGGDECGLQLYNFSNFAEGDIIECYSVVKEAQTLL